DLALLALLPGGGALLGFADPAFLVLLALALRLRHALLAPGLLDRLGVLQPGLLGGQRDEETLQLAAAADLVGRVAGHATLGRPEAEADHLLEDDLVLGGSLDPVVEFLARDHDLGRQTAGAAAEGNLRKAEDWGAQLKRPRPPGGRESPGHNMHGPWVGEGRTVKSEPVTLSASWCMVGDPPTGLQGYVPSTATLDVCHSSYVLFGYVLYNASTSFRGRSCLACCSRRASICSHGPLRS